MHGLCYFYPTKTLPKSTRVACFQIAAYGARVAFTSEVIVNQSID